MLFTPLSPWRGAGGEASCGLAMASCGVASRMFQDSLYHHKRADHAHKEPRYNLPKRVLAKYHATGSNQSAHDKHQTKPPYRVEHEEKSKGHQTACHATYGCRVRGNLPPNVDKRANHLHNEGGNQYAGHETRYL